MARSHDSSVFLFSCRAVYLGCAVTAKLDGKGDSGPLRVIQKPLERLYGGGAGGRGFRGGGADDGFAPASERPRGAFVTVFSTGVQLEVSGGGGGGVEPSQLFFWFSVDRLLLAAAVKQTAAPGGGGADAKPWRPRRRKDRPTFAEAGSPQAAYSRHPALLALLVASEPLPTRQHQHPRRRQGRALAADCHCLVPSSDAQARLLETACRFACVNSDALADDVHEMWQDAMSRLSISGDGRYDNGRDGGAVDNEGEGESELVDTRLTSVSDASSESNNGGDDSDRGSYDDERHRNGYHVPPEIYDGALRPHGRNFGTERDSAAVGGNWQLNVGGSFSAASYPTERLPIGPSRRRPGSPPRSSVASSGWSAHHVATRSHEGGGSRRFRPTARNDAPWPAGDARLLGYSGRAQVSSVRLFAAGHVDDGRLQRQSRERARSEAGSAFGQSATRARSVDGAVSRHSSREVVAPVVDSGSAWPRDHGGALDGGGGGGGMVVNIPRVLHTSVSSGRWEAQRPTSAASQQVTKTHSVSSEWPGADRRQAAEPAGRFTAVAERQRYATVSGAAVAERPAPRSKTTRPPTPPEDYRDDIPWVAATSEPSSERTKGEQVRTGSLKRTTIQVRTTNMSGGGRTESNRPPGPMLGTPQRPQMPPPPPPILVQPPPPPPPPLPRAYTVSGDGAGASRVLSDRRSDLMRSIREYVNERAFAQSLEAELSRAAPAASGGPAAPPQ